MLESTVRPIETLAIIAVAMLMGRPIQPIDHKDRFELGKGFLRGPRERASVCLGASARGIRDSARRRPITYRPQEAAAQHLQKDGGNSHDAHEPRC